MHILGIDIGGTSIKGAVVDNLGKTYESFVMPIVKGENQENTVKSLINEINNLLNSLSNSKVIEGIGIGIPGSIDSINGIVTFSPNLGWKDLHIVELLKKSLKMPIKVTNDANAAALGESFFGAGKKYNDLVMITIGTGIGSGIIVNGKILEGLNGKAGEIGHTTLVYGGIECGCGRKGCFEAYASAIALINQTKAAMDLYKDSLMWDEYKKENKYSGRIAFEAAKRGDLIANKVVDQYIEYLSEGLLNICNALRPECIVLSGGVANQGDYLISKVKAYCEKFNYGYPNSPVTEIKIAELGYESGIVGAAALFF